jgi:hypothetical protein
MKDDTPPSGLTAGTPPQLPSTKQQAGEDQSRSGPFPPTLVGDDISQVSETVSPAELASVQLQLANFNRR